MHTAPTLRLVVPDEPSAIRLFTGEPSGQPTLARRKSRLRYASSYELAAPLRRIIADVRQSLSARQQTDGHFGGHAACHARAHSEFVLLACWLDIYDQDNLQKAARLLLRQQLACGGWPETAAGPADISTTVLAYFALKLAGFAAHEEPLQCARRFLLARGGADQTDVIARCYLALFGQIPYEACHVPQAKSYHGRPTTVRSAVRTLLAVRSVKIVDPQCGIRELFCTPPTAWPIAAEPSAPRSAAARGMAALSTILRRATGWFLPQTNPDSRPRRRAKLLRRFEQELLQAVEASVFDWPSLALSIPVLSASAGDQMASLLDQQLKRLKQLIEEDSETIRVSHPVPPSNDTASALTALCEAGLSPRSAAVWAAWQAISAKPPGAVNHPEIENLASQVQAQSCLLRQEKKEDRKRDAIPPELQLCDHSLPRSRALDLSADAMQDRLKADLEELLGYLTARPPSYSGSHMSWAVGKFTGRPRSRAAREPETAARVLAALGDAGLRVGDKRIDAAVDSLRAAQQPDGRWDLGHVCENPSPALAAETSAVAVTARVLLGLSAIGVPAADPAVKAGVHWLLAHEQPGGGWGERSRLDNDYLPGEGPPTIGDTARAVIALIAAGQDLAEAASRAIEWLLRCDIVRRIASGYAQDVPTLTVAEHADLLRALCLWSQQGDNTMSDQTVGVAPLSVARCGDAAAC